MDGRFIKDDLGSKWTDTKLKFAVRIMNGHLSKNGWSGIKINVHSAKSGRSKGIELKSGLSINIVKADVPEHRK